MHKQNFWKQLASMVELRILRAFPRYRELERQAAALGVEVAQLTAEIAMLKVNHPQPVNGLRAMAAGAALPFGPETTTHENAPRRVRTANWSEFKHRIEGSDY